MSVGRLLGMRSALVTMAAVGIVAVACGGLGTEGRGVADRARDGGGGVADAGTGGRAATPVDEAGIAGGGGSIAVGGSSGVGASPPDAADASVLPDAMAPPDASLPPPDGPWLGDAAAGLAGYYDVWLSGSGDPDCPIAERFRHLNLSLIQNDRALTSTLFEDYNWWDTGATVVARADALVVTATARTDETLPALTLARDAHGLTGTGAARVLLTCFDGSQRDAVLLLRVGPDVTPPTIAISLPSTFPVVYPFSAFWFHISEPIDKVDPEWPNFLDLGEAVASLQLVDAATGAPVPTTLFQNPGGPGIDATFADPDAAVGKTVRLGLETAFHDAAGNLAVPGEDTFDVHSGGPIETDIDFDQRPPSAFDGAVEYHPPGNLGSFCESGGCVTIDAMNLDCDSLAELPVDGALPVRLDDSAEKFEFRYRVLSTTSAPVMVRIEERGTAMSERTCQLSTLPAIEDGAFLYGTDWTTEARWISKSPDAPDEGLVFYPPCSRGTGGGRPRLVIEWIRTIQAADGG